MFLFTFLDWLDDNNDRYFTWSCKREKAINGSNIPAQVKSPTVIRAEEIQLSLGSEFPSFVKLLVRSHVSSCFWMVSAFKQYELSRNVILWTSSRQAFCYQFLSAGPSHAVLQVAPTKDWLCCYPGRWKWGTVWNQIHLRQDRT